LLTTFYYFANIFIALCYTTNKLTNLAANRDLPWYVNFHGRRKAVFHYPKDNDPLKHPERNTVE